MLLYSPSKVTQPLAGIESCQHHLFNMKSLLPQHSQKAFQTYAPHIAKIIENAPSPTVLKPSNTSTFIARIRDSLNGMRLNQWTAKDFTFADAAGVFAMLREGGEFIFTSTNDGIYCGPKIKDNGAIPSVKGVVLSTTGDAELDAREEDIFAAILLLKRKNLLPKPVTFHNLNPQQETSLTNDLHIELIREGSKYIII